MKNLILFILLSPLSGFAQQTPDFDSKKETSLFLKQFFKDDTLKSYVKQSTTGSKDFLCAIDESNFLDNDEIKHANEQLKNIDDFIWTEDLYKNINIISDSSFLKSDKDQLVEELKANIFVISNPIFIRNGTYCIFFYRVVCGNICNESDVSLYVKEDGKWLKKEEYCSWMN